MPNDEGGTSVMSDEAKNDVGARRGGRVCARNRERSIATKKSKLSFLLSRGKGSALKSDWHH